jgi:hypothetical protein
MSKMGNFVVAIEEALFEGASAEEIASQFNLSIATVEEIIARLEDSYAEPDIDSYTEYQDLPWGGDDAFETCSYAEDF